MPYLCRSVTELYTAQSSVHRMSVCMTSFLVFLGLFILRSYLHKSCCSRCIGDLGAVADISSHDVLAGSIATFTSINKAIILDWSDKQ